MPLDKYHGKRKFAATPEPKGEKAGSKIKSKNDLFFVIQKHHASHLHYDFRLLADGVLKSWAVPKGLSMDPDQKRLAVMVEDHPKEYANFEGEIPAGQYGAGTVLIWDKGAYGPTKNEDPEAFVTAGIKKGHFSFYLDGHFVKGAFSLIHLPRRGQNAWIITKKRDEFSAADGGEDPARELNIEAPKSPMPRRVQPMLATLIDKPFSKDDWLFEIKWDGYRAIAEINDGSIELYSRKFISFSARFPPITDALNQLEGRMVLDGEIVVVDQAGKSHFQLLQRYQKTGAGTPVYYVFDLIYYDRYDLTALPLIERKEILKHVLPLNLPNIKFCDHVEGRGEALFEAAKAQGLEGIIGKRKKAPYRPGGRGKDWVKIRNRLVAEAVIAGYTAPRGSRESFGSLILGIYEDGDFKYVGHVGTGFSDNLLSDLAGELKKVAAKASPFPKKVDVNAPVSWVEPRLVAQVEFNGWTEKGVMRQPVFMGLREDKTAVEVTKEIPKKYPQIAKSHEFDIDGHTVAISNPEKVLWPDEGYQKKDLINYYKNVAEIMLPYLKERPESLHRFPDGILGQRFYQKDASELNLPEWVETINIESGSRGEEIKYILCQNKASLIYLANLGCIEINPWNSAKGNLNNPDYVVIDLDPEETSFDYVVQTAIALRGILEELEIPGFPKTSGATGMHIYIPLGRKYDYAQAKRFSEIISTLINNKVPQITSLARSPGHRKGKVYPDWLQNLKGQTVAAAYSLRPQPSAPVSTPLKWDELHGNLRPEQFNIKTIFKRLDKYGDLFTGVLGPGIDMKKTLAKL